MTKQSETTYLHFDEFARAPLDCDHVEAEVDILTGEMHCHCGYRRVLSGEELSREAEFQAEAMEAYYRECEQTEQDAKAAT